MGDEAVTAKRHLVILDVNGMLVHRWRPVGGERQPQQEPDATTSRGQLLYNRPYMREAVELLCKSFSVLVWSSMQGHNLEEVVAHCFQDKVDTLLGVWDQTKCTEVRERDMGEGFREQHGIRAGKPIFLKELRRLQDHPALAHFYPNNVLLIDDSLYKAVRNPPNTAIHPLAWSPESEAAHDDELEMVCKYLKRLLRASSVSEMVRDNPFPLWKLFQKKVLQESHVERASGWCLRRASQAEALTNIWEQEVLKANNARKEKLLSVMTMATKIARSVAQQRGEENGGKGGGESTSGSGEAEVMTMVEAMWPRFPRAVRHTFRHCKPDTDGSDLLKCVVDTFNHTFDPRRLLDVKAGESLGPLWREVEYAAKNNSLLPSLSEMRAMMSEAAGDMGVVRERLQEARKRKRLDNGSTGRDT
uniref:Mitochondrial import inner membrane translocase subunit TIM50 n=1 Tax=Tetraselmis chuii TaxID=63592 RepID=A0A7S1X8D4_9CHLO|mmetsp:Transcript_39754/g.71349  ORF Transcript_39754/g.71349 Transcript_39754/m.71349 type:complete len:417 (+) Transcript_39754:349-1599(+)|eukprot:CAMPEP_0177776720 /NCGR_PEP_ID=MMETSP0491_2-20121128/14871_1 /TAXON_ID=63592 /ORGANISM="Tetraselmis chuii, Strain PLY429" /LENGTH=416 /DNA_ID=CAMNT_0019295545 /DNA_START=335 /DNA_END=1585 /DNA_ORIENTATION=+